MEPLFDVIKPLPDGKEEFLFRAPLGVVVALFSRRADRDSMRGVARRITTDAAEGRPTGIWRNDDMRDIWTRLGISQMVTVRATPEPTPLPPSSESEEAT